ncbi:GNAT family N-acetyltransferase [Nocardioides rubriscoriae]|uniref:GNAT family N-acetyltransferase n=1 Tax=Nocardioides rubriscoriae TaxID=642762 RepID=UPI0011DFF19F|nr:GNAT family N-acetyltransferase [Nocardioides rubriscoriae]
MRDDDLLALQSLASRTWTRAARHHPGQLAWSARYAESTSDVVRTWVEDGRVVGWGWAEEPDWLELCVDSTHPWATDVAREVVAWFLDQTPAEVTRTMVLASEHLLLTVLGEAGFVPEKGPWFTHHHLDLARLRPVPDVPGYRLRAVQSGEAAPRAACHRAAWTPPGGSSQVTTAAYDALMATPPYRADLDRVAIAADGSWVASCLVWLDDATGVALVEPVGCAPEHQRRGLASAVSLAALAAARAAGATQALVCPRGDQDHPVPAVLYRGLGFEPGERTVTLVRE